MLKDGFYKGKYEEENKIISYLLEIDGDDAVMIETTVTVTKFKNDYEFSAVWTKISEEEHLKKFEDICQVVEV